jgi:hypothetical protein
MADENPNVPDDISEKYGRWPNVLEVVGMENSDPGANPDNIDKNGEMKQIEPMKLMKGGTRKIRKGIKKTVRRNSNKKTIKRNKSKKSRKSRK